MVEYKELISNKKGFFDNLKITTPKFVSIDEFVSLRSKIYAFKRGSDSKSKLKRSAKSQSKNFKIDEFKKCLHGKGYKNCDNYLICSIYHEMYLQKLTKDSLSPF